MTTIAMSPSLADMRAVQADNLDKLRDTLQNLNVRDLVPLLVARRVLQSFEMGTVYGKPSPQEQVDALIAILKTKNHWMGPMTDALIRNGQATVAKQLLEIQQSSPTHQPKKSY